jgi:hypothetical protein
MWHEEIARTRAKLDKEKADFAELCADMDKWNALAEELNANGHALSEAQQALLDEWNAKRQARGEALEELETAQAKLDALRQAELEKMQSIPLDPGLRERWRRWGLNSLDPSLIPFGEAAYAIAMHEFRSLGEAERLLRKLCRKQKVRAFRDGKQIKSKEWIDNQPDLDGEIEVNEGDVYVYQLREMAKQKPSLEPALIEQMDEAKEALSDYGGKQPRIIKQLEKRFNGEAVPGRSECPREALTAYLVKADPSLAPLTHKTLNKAIESYNASLGNGGSH